MKGQGGMNDNRIEERIEELFKADRIAEDIGAILHQQLPPQIEAALWRAYKTLEPVFTWAADEIDRLYEGL